MNEQMKV